MLACLPRIITLGVATADEVDIDTLQQRPDEERTQSTASISATSCVTLVLASRGFEVAGRVWTSLDDGAQPFVAHHAGQALGVSFGADYFRFTLVITKQPDSRGGLPLENAVCTDFRGAMWRPLWHWEPFVGGNIHRCI